MAKTEPREHPPALREDYRLWDTDVDGMSVARERELEQVFGKVPDRFRIVSCGLTLFAVCGC
jgi:hypothetical protein